MVGLYSHVMEYLLRVPWVWGFPWGFQWDTCGYGMGMGIEMPSPRQPCKWHIYLICKDFVLEKFLLILYNFLRATFNELYGLHITKLPFHSNDIFLNRINIKVLNWCGKLDVVMRITRERLSIHHSVTILRQISPQSVISTRHDKSGARHHAVPYRSVAAGLQGLDRSRPRRSLSSH